MLDIQRGGGGGSKVVQVVNFQTGAKATGTTTIPQDDTIPQNTEGDEYMTLAITPTNVSNKLVVDVVLIASNSAANHIVAALFQDSIANALAFGIQFQPTATGLSTIYFKHYMIAGTISPITFKVRGGGTGAGTTTFNGQSGNRLFGGVLASSVTVTESLP